MAQPQSATKRKRFSPENSLSRPMPSISSDPAQFSPDRQILLSKPVNIGEFSLDISRNLQLGRSQVRYLNEAVIDKKMSTNLANGIENFVQKDRDEGIDQILRWINRMAAPNSSLKKTIHESEFVTWRGTLTRLSTSTYDVGSYAVGIKVACVKYKGVYFLREFDTQAKLLSESTRSDYQRRACYAGFKFEQICTTDEIGQRPDTTAPVNQNNEFIGMFKATLSSPVLQQNGANQGSGSDTPPRTFRIVFGAEIDCISPQGHYMEIKTQFKEFGHGKGFGNKALKWWIQSYLIGIRQFVIGIHENLILNRIELHKIDSLTKSYTELNFNTTVCFAFLHSFLQTVKDYLDREDEGILVVERLPTSHEFKFQWISPENVEDTAKYQVISNEFKVHGWT